MEFVWVEVVGVWSSGMELVGGCARVLEPQKSNIFRTFFQYFSQNRREPKTFVFGVFGWPCWFATGSRRKAKTGIIKARVVRRLSVKKGARVV